jgi:hypothetical protein
VPAAWAAKLPSSTRVLITDGTRDPNVPPSTIGPLARALRQADVAGPGFKLLQGTDHYMHLASQPDTQAVLPPQLSAPSAPGPGRSPRLPPPGSAGPGSTRSARSPPGAG